MRRIPPSPPLRSAENCSRPTTREPWNLSHTSFYSDRLKLQFWDYGDDGKPSLVLVHGGLDHARSWDWVARPLREHYHVYALDLRGHGNSAWAPGAMYSVAEHVLDLSALLDIIDDFPIRLIGHSLGGSIVLHYCGVYPDRAFKAVSIEGLGAPLEQPRARSRVGTDALLDRVHPQNREAPAENVSEPRSGHRAHEGSESASLG